MSHPSFGELGGEDAFAILGVAPSADDNEIRGARRRLLRRFHPDLPGGDLARSQMVTAASHILLDPLRRRCYEAAYTEGAEQVARERPSPDVDGGGGARYSGLRRRTRNRWSSLAVVAALSVITLTPISLLLGLSALAQIQRTGRRGKPFAVGAVMGGVLTLAAWSFVLISVLEPLSTR